MRLMILELIPKTNSKFKRKMDYRMSSKKRPQWLLLVALALGMAMASVMLLGKLRQGRVFSLLLREQDQQILTLQLLLQREKETSKAMKRKVEDFRTKDFILRTQKTALSNKLMETQIAADHLQKMQNEMEASLEEKQSQIRSLTEKSEELNLKVSELSEFLKQKDSEVEEAKKQFKKLSTDSAERREVNTVIEGKSGQNEETRRDGKWVKSHTDANEERLEDHPSEEATISQGSAQEIKEKNEVLENNEEQEADGGRVIESSQASATKIEDERKEPESTQPILNNVEKKEMVSAQDGQESATPKELRIEAAGKEHKVQRNKNRGKGRRRRATPRGREYENRSIREDNKYGSKGNKELEGERKETVHGANKLEISEGSQAVARANGNQDRIDLEARTEAKEEITSTEEQSEMSQNPSRDEAKNGSKEANASPESIPKQTDVAPSTTEEEDSKVSEGDNSNKDAEGEENELSLTKEQSGKFENPQGDEAQNEDKNESMGNVTRALADLNTEKESDTVKQEKEGVNNENNPKYTADDDGEDSEVHKGKETADMKDQTEKPENPEEVEVKNENADDENRASVDSNTEKENDAEKQDGAVKKATDISTTQKSESMTDTDDSSSEEIKEQ